jgi:transcriptional regulator with XRE-family HTH domain
MARSGISLPFDGARLRQWRERAGLTQQELADRCGLSRFQISRWETGQTKPAPRALPPLVHGLTEILSTSGCPEPFTLNDLLDRRGSGDCLK